MRLAQLLYDQDGVVARWQVLAAGHDDAFIERMVRRREWARPHPGIYLEHTGRPTWNQRAWAAVLYYHPAALSHASALGPPGLTRRGQEAQPVMHVAIAHPRSATELPGVRLHRVRGLHERVRWSARPPRVAYSEALLDVAAEQADPVDALALIADACQRRRTTPALVREALTGRTRLRHRAWLLRALDDVGAGALSVLESGYLRKVERGHGLPRGTRQTEERTEDGTVQRDVLYRRLGVVVELDGRIGHELFRDRADDMDRDLLAATDRILTIRLGWRQVEQRACMTAARLAAVLQHRGWPGSARPCGPTCAIGAQRVGSPAPGAGDPTR